MTRKFDAIIVGAGQAGPPLAGRLTAAGQTVAVIERKLVGGTCVNYGCIPTKTLVASAHTAHVARRGAEYGIGTGEVTVDIAKVKARKDAVMLDDRHGVESWLAGMKGCTLIRGHARFEGPHTIRVDDEVLEADRIFLNVGGRAVVPNIPGLSDVDYLTNVGILDLDVLPEHLVIIGGSYIALEFAQMYRRFGARVTVLEKGPRLTAREDEDVSAAIKDILEAEDIEVHVGATSMRIIKRGNGFDLYPRDGAEPVSGTHLLVATGRTPNTGDLGCAAGNVAVDAQGRIVVDERYETSEPGVFAAGDCVPGPQFTHVSWDDHRVLFDLLTGRPARKRTDRVVPYTVFTDPQVAGVGLSEAAARARGFEIEVATMPFGNIARAIETDETAGVVKIVLDAKTERLLGVSVVGVDAGELVHVFSVLMQAGASARAIVDGEFAHPTFAEGMQTALMKLPRYALS